MPRQGISQILVDGLYFEITAPDYSDIKRILGKYTPLNPAEKMIPDFVPETEPQVEPEAPKKKKGKDGKE